MTLANEAFQGDQPLSAAADNVNWRVVPAAAVAAGIFYGLEQVNSTVAKGLAWLVFLTAFVGGDTLTRPELQDQTTPLGTLLKTFGYSVNYKSSVYAPGTTHLFGGIPYTASK